MSSALLCALYEALTMIEEEGLDARWARHERNHRAFVEGLSALGMSLLPPESDRLFTLNTVKIPDGVDDAAVRKLLLKELPSVIGSGLGPLAGRIWRVGLMGTSSASRLVVLLVGALQSALAGQSSMPRTLAGRYVLVHMIAATISCATNPATGQRQLSFVSEEREIAMGQENDARDSQGDGLVPGPGPPGVRHVGRHEAGDATPSAPTCHGISRWWTCRPSTPSRCQAATSI